MAINQPITATTQIGIVTGTAEGYATQASLVEIIKPLILNDFFQSGTGAPTSTPTGTSKSFYVDSSTTPDNLYWWNPTTSSWSLIGDGTGTGATIQTGNTTPVGVPAGLPLYVQNGVSGGLWFYNAGTSAWVKVADTNAINAIAPCSAPLATLAEVTAMSADPSTLKVSVCNDDGSPSTVAITGIQLADILGVEAPVTGCSATPATLAEVAAMKLAPATLKVAVCNDDGTPTTVGVNGVQLQDILSIANLRYVTPRDFVATAGSGGDDTAAVQAAMASDKPMYIDRTYRISAAATHSTSASKMVFGNGHASSIILMTNATQDGLVKIGGGSLTVRDITVTTNVNKTSGYGIFTLGTLKDEVSGCLINGQSPTVQLFGGISINGLIPYIASNYILNCSSAGLVITNSNTALGSEGTIQGNVFNTGSVGNTASAILYTSGLLTLKVANNTFQNYAYGIQMAPITGLSEMSLIATGNTFEANSVGAVVITQPSGSTTIVGAVLINGNQFRQVAGKSIILTGATNFIKSCNISANVFDIQNNFSISLNNGTLVNVEGNVFSVPVSSIIPIELTATLPIGTFFDSNHALSVTNLYQLNGNTGAYKSAPIVAA